MVNFSDKVTTENEGSKIEEVKDYYKSIFAHTNDRTQRETRNRIIRKMLIPFLIARDKKRNFSTSNNNALNNYRGL